MYHWTEITSNPESFPVGDHFIGYWQGDNFIFFRASPNADSDKEANCLWCAEMGGYWWLPVEAIGAPPKPTG